MNVRIIAAGGGQNVVIGGGVGDLLADVDEAAVNVRERGAVHEAIDEWGFRILKDGVDAARDGGRPGPIVIFFGDDEDVLDLPGIVVPIVVAVLGAGTRTAEQSQECDHAKGAEIAECGHRDLQSLGFAVVAGSPGGRSFRVT
jgi:hypothetical protein